MRKTLTALALLPLIGCGPVAPLGPTAALPFDAVQGAGDPTRSAIYTTAYAFNNPGGLADPSVAARASANVEFLAASIPQDPRYGFAPLLNGQLALARDELHLALGVAPNASPQLVVDGLYGASRALRAQDPAAAANALSPLAFPDRQATLTRLSAMPALPQVAAATATAEQELVRSEQERINGRRGGGGRRS
jgi:hypothetical protein